MNAPLPSDYSPMQAGYIAAASNKGDIIGLLNSLKDDTYTYLMALPAEKADYAYAEGKWTIKQLIGHMSDTERVFAYRLLCFARGEQQVLPGFDQDEYEASNNVASRTLQDLAEEFKMLRQVNMYVINNLSAEQLEIRGKASDYTITVKALLYAMAGHEIHHMNILKERY
ncbi:DinB family protein [Mucilaginibacter agri]|uniref:DinB family protein n=1 Tax=Mucilaginibacter agri TaxID=2695265 RepID=A0A965ZGC6_9SPHI|nr:DinB family protein [Mucilaginibacter agri]NCD69171.1 DinB family protein [Mucilaginibacter agri]